MLPEDALPENPALGASQAEWFRRWQRDKDPDCLNELLKSEVEVVKRMIQKRARSLLQTLGATDIAHEAVLGLLRVKTLPEFPTTAAFRSYLWKSAWRLLMARLEARSKRPHRVDVTSVDQIHSMLRSSSDSSNADKADAITALELAMNLLRSEDRELIDLIHLQGKSVSDAAALLGITRENASMRATRARRRLKERLRDWALVIGVSE